MNREERIQALLGQQVHVVMDRPIGYVHRDIVYPVNYGFLPGILAGDGEEQDAYVLGVDRPLEEFTGYVIGAVCRRNDVEDKLVVAPEGVLLHQAEILEAVWFQEQYFDVYVDSLVQRSCGVIPFRGHGARREYLILLQTNRYWSFPKGHMEPGETETQTALRELQEECGLSAGLIPGMRAMAQYPLFGNRVKQVVLFPGLVEGTLCLAPNEILDAKWVHAHELPNYLQNDLYEAIKPLLQPELALQPGIERTFL